METLFELTFQDQTLNPQIGTFTDASQTTGTFTLEDGEYYLTNADSKGFYVYSPVAIQPGLVGDSKVIIEFDLKVVTASANTHAIIGTYAGVDGGGIPTGAKIALRYNAGDIELVLGGGATATLIESADVVVDQWYHFRIDCYLAAPLASTYQVKIDGVAVTTVTGAAADYALGVISVLGTDLHACDECGIKNITLVTETDMFVGRTALEQALQDVKGYVDTTKIPLTGSNAISGDLIPATDNSIDIGSSTKNIKTLYTKGITIDGKTIDTDANGNMTYDGHIADTIEEQGNGYIRYSNGLQICWTYNELSTQSSSGTWTYPKTFISMPGVWWQAVGSNTVYVDAVNGGLITPSNAVFIPSRYKNGSVVAAGYGVIGLAIGRWK